MVASVSQVPWHTALSTDMADQTDVKMEREDPGLTTCISLLKEVSWLRFKGKWPFAANVHMVLDPPCWGVRNKATSTSHTWIFFVLDAPVRSLLSCMVDFVPCAKGPFKWKWKSLVQYCYFFRFFFFFFFLTKKYLLLTQSTIFTILNTTYLQ